MKSEHIFGLLGLVAGFLGYRWLMTEDEPAKEEAKK